MRSTAKHIPTRETFQTNVSVPKDMWCLIPHRPQKQTVVGVVQFSAARKTYRSKQEFDDDFEQHCVPPERSRAWRDADEVREGFVVLKFLSAREPVLVPDEWHHATHLRPRTA